MVHPLTQPPVENRTDHAIDRLKEKNQNEQQNTRGRLRRKNRRQPSAHAMHQREVQQRQNRRRQRVHQIPLRPVIEEVVLQREIDQQRPRKDREDYGRRGEQIRKEGRSSLVGNADYQYDEEQG